MAATGGVARAQAVVELVPSLAAGYTTSAIRTDAGLHPESTEFGTASLNARYRYQGARSLLAAGYRLSYTQFGETGDLDTQYPTSSFTTEVALATAFNLAATLDLHLGAAAAITRSNVPLVADPTVDIQAETPTTRLYATYAANQDVVYSPRPDRRYTQGLHFEQVQYFVPDGELQTEPETTTVGLHLRGERELARDHEFIDLSVADSYVLQPITASADQLSGQTLTATLFAGWRRDLTALWSFEVQGGPLFVYRFADDVAIVSPGGLAILAYRRLLWYATLTASRLPIMNVYEGDVTISNQLIARVSMPLSARELVLVSGYAGYTYANKANGSGEQPRAFDSFQAGASLVAHLPTLPFWGSLDYIVVDQRGSGTTDEFPDLFRQSIFVTIGGTFMFGRGTPPLFHRVL